VGFVGLFLVCDGYILATVQQKAAVVFASDLKAVTTIPNTALHGYSNDF